MTLQLRLALTVQGKEKMNCWGDHRAGGGRGMGGAHGRRQRIWEIEGSDKRQVETMTMGS